MIIKIVYNKKKRAISPVIAVILLIGLAVAAVAAIFIVVLPLMQPTSNLELTDAYITYDSAFTKTADAGIGYGKGSVFLANAGTGKIQVTDIKIFHAASSAASEDDWTEITIQDGAESLQDVSINNPYELSPLAIDEELTIRFPIPNDNFDSSRAYKIIVTADDGTEIDTSRESIVDEEDMLLAKDRPDITPPSSIGTIRRITQISASGTPTDNSEVKNVTYEVSTTSDFSDIVKTETITSPLWRWQWDTRNSSAEGLDNGTYYLRMTVHDYAGLSDTAGPLTFTIDNDYVKPTISTVVGASIKNGPDIAEVGESFSITATITDSGSADSAVEEAFIHYKLNDTSPTYSIISMTGVGDTWSGNIPAAYITSAALENNLTYFITAVDKDENEDQSTGYFADVNDSTEPNFYLHVFEGETITLQTTLVGDEGLPLTISVSIEDMDTVSEVTIVWRERNDSTVLNYDPWQVFTNISGTGETWTFRIPSVNVTIDGIEYYVNATDPAGNIAFDGDPIVPYRISVEDLIAPVATVLSDVPAKITAGTDLPITVSVIDNDPSFSWTGHETGSVEIGYQRIGLDLDYNYFSINHTQGDSSVGEIAIWEGTIDGDYFNASYDPVLIRIRATDIKGWPDQLDYTVYVSIPGTPVLQYVSGSVEVSGSSNQTLSFDVNNSAGGATPATATITDIEITLTDNTKDPYTGNPLLIQVNATGGANPLWVNGSSPSAGISGYKVTLNSTINLIKGASLTFDLVYANSSGGYFNVNDLTVNVTIYYSTGYETLEIFNTPITTFEDQTQTRWMRSDTHVINGLSAYQLGTTQSSSFLENNQQSDRYSGDLAVEWGIRVWIRHADSSEYEVTSGSTVAVVQRLAGDEGVGILTTTWTPDETELEITDALVIRVYMTIGSTDYSPTEFITEQLGAIKLLGNEPWSVNYHTARDYRGWPQLRTRGIFSWGDSSHDSRITNIQIRVQSSGGGGASIQPKIFSSPLSSDPSTILGNDILLSSREYLIILREMISSYFFNKDQVLYMMKN